MIAEFLQILPRQLLFSTLGNLRGPGRGCPTNFAREFAKIFVDIVVFVGHFSIRLNNSTRG
jgi:hypothetical protein